MAVINILSPHVADLIAAGEVVDRPANVVKELVENAVDAGADSITVAIDRGGAGRIQVTDNGCGMAPEDAGVAFLRHATSKLRDARGLEAIGTLGFRGEALAAISAVSRVTLLTRRPEDAEGTRMTLEAGEIQEMHPCGCPVGTSITVEDLFYNTPARRKFLKTDKTEGAACVAMALRCALGRPEIRLRCIKDGQEQFFAPGDGKTESAVYALLGRDYAAGLLPCGGECEGVAAEGFVSAPHAGKGSRAGQYFFVNGRAVRSGILQAAVEQAYKNRLLTGRFPACVLWIRLGLGAVDVNVHPTKTEVRFSDERRVFDAVYHGVLGALEAVAGTKEIRLEAPARPAAAPAPRQDRFQTLPAQDFRREKTAEEKSAGPARSWPVQTAPAPAPAPASRRPAETGALRQPALYYQARPETPPPGIRRPEPAAEPAEQLPFPAPVPPQLERLLPPDAPDSLTPAAPAARLVGEVLDTYILLESGEALLLIDKHAAHERILFDRLKAGRGKAMSQTLLVPLPYSPGPESAALLLEHRAELEELGFLLEPYGEGAVVVRAVPAELRGGELALLEELAETLRRGGAAALGDETLHTMACKAAVKAGTASEPEELLALARAVLAGEVKYCPHGRPIAVTLTKKELDKQFSRIV